MGIFDHTTVIPEDGLLRGREGSEVDVDAVTTGDTAIEPSHDDWTVETAAAHGSNGSGSKSDPYTDGLQTLVNDLDTEIGGMSKRIILNAYFETTLDISASNYRFDSAGLQTTRLQAQDADNDHTIEAQGSAKGFNLFDLWIDQRDSSGSYDTLLLKNSEIFMGRLDIEANGSSIRRMLTLDGCDEVKMNGIHMQGSGVSDPDAVKCIDVSDVQIANVDASNSTGDWKFSSNSAGGVTDVSMVNVDIPNNLRVWDVAGPPTHIRMANIDVGGSMNTQAHDAVYSGMRVEEDLTYFGGERQHVTGAINGGTQVGVNFNGPNGSPVTNSTFRGSVEISSNVDVKFEEATNCLFMGPINDGVEFANAIDCDVWPVGPFNGSITDNGTRSRFFGVIGGGPLGGVDLSTTDGQFDGDRAIADGTSTSATAFDLAVWDSSLDSGNGGWHVFNADTTQAT